MGCHICSVLVFVRCFLLFLVGIRHTAGFLKIVAVGPEDENESHSWGAMLKFLLAHG